MPVAQQISSIQSATEESASAIKKITETINRVPEISSTVAIATRQIAVNVQQASEGTSTVASNIGDVERGSSQTGTASAEVLAAAQCLSAQSRRLKSEVGTFLVTVRAA